MHTNLIRTPVTAVATIAAAVLLAAPVAQARDVEPGEAAWVITAEDLSTPTGRIADASSNAQGPSIPSSCSNVNSGRTASGRNSLSTIMGEVDYRNGTTWQSTVWTYRTPAAAQASFAKLQTQTLTLCNDSFTGLIGDDVADMPAVLVDRARKVPSGTQPRFSVASSLVMTDPANARPGYTNNFRYTVFTRIDDAIVQVNMFQGKPVTAAQRADAARATTAIAKRYAASQ